VHLVGFLFVVVIADARNREPEICGLSPRANYTDRAADAGRRIKGINSDENLGSVVWGSIVSCWISVFNYHLFNYFAAVNMR
jgi:hypothetical protein